jgi:putative hydrolase of the HAD superfamily
MKRYKNIVFDLGNVLIDYSPHSIVANFTQDVKVINLLVHEIFYKQEWLDLDQGIITYDQAYHSISHRIDSEYYPHLKEILNRWHDYLSDREEMIELLNLLKLNGYKLFLFSNTPHRFDEYKKNLKCLDYFEKTIISADIKLSKPNIEFYHSACQLCDIKPNESFFIDDSAQNIIHANKIEMDGYIYNGNLQLLYQYLSKLEIL